MILKKARNLRFKGFNNKDDRKKMKVGSNNSFRNV